MAFIEITSDEDYVYIEFNNAAQEFVDSKVQRSAFRSVNKVIEDKGVEIFFQNGDMVLFKYQYIDSIDGDTNITNNTILRDKLRALMKP